VQGGVNVTEFYLGFFVKEHDFVESFCSHSQNHVMMMKICSLYMFITITRRLYLSNTVCYIAMKQWPTPNVFSEGTSTKHHLDSYLSKNTSEDNDSFSQILEESDKKHREKHAWLYENETSRVVVSKSLWLFCLNLQDCTKGIICICIANIWYCLELRIIVITFMD